MLTPLSNRAPLLLCDSGQAQAFTVTVVCRARVTRRCHPGRWRHAHRQHILVASKERHHPRKPATAGRSGHKSCMMMCQFSPVSPSLVPRDARDLLLIQHNGESDVMQGVNHFMPVEVNNRTRSTIGQPRAVEHSLHCASTASTPIERQLPIQNNT